MRNERLLLCALFLILFPAVAVLSQARGGAVSAPDGSGAVFGSIVWAEGSTFTLLRGSSRRVYSVDDLEAIGTRLISGDILQTGPSTFLELSVREPRASIQIAENTSFLCSSDSAGRSSSGELHYGRIRAKVATLSGNSSFRLSTPTLVAGVRGTDFGCDLLVDQDASSAAGVRMTHRVFCFSGAVLVSEITDEGSGVAAEPVELSGGDMVERVIETGSSSEAPVPLSSQPVSGEVEQFWGKRPVLGLDPALPASDEPIAEALPPPREPRTWKEGSWTVLEIIRPEWRKEELLMRNRQIPSWAVAGLMTLGSTACVTGAWYDASVDSASSIPERSLSAGLVMIGTGSLLGLISSLVP
ncbi:FecR domain-containing protein [Treponema zuelzerae]|uniref:FecR domain-containing protein n=1 Tax=Teretinema zuelzerae TaxID=156 RepID=A0AAE3EHS8_9SPIR|nr:FecR domain-containing protein [Teretinema zuelzerae]MCD1655250.1 FecR domain-containing protein [Teretinema zuelzerae]